MAYTLSDEAPIIRVDLEGAQLDADLHAMIAEVTALMHDHQREKRKSAIVVDLSRAEALSARQRKLIGEWRAQVKDLTTKVAVGIAMVVTSPLVRGVLTAISWFAHEPVEVIYVDSLAAAYRWGVERCDAAGIAVPDPVRHKFNRA